MSGIPESESSNHSHSMGVGVGGVHSCTTSCRGIHVARSRRPRFAFFGTHLVLTRCVIPVCSDGLRVSLRSDRPDGDSLFIVEPSAQCMDTYLRFILNSVHVLSQTEERGIPCLLG